MGSRIIRIYPNDLEKDSRSFIQREGDFILKNKSVIHGFLIQYSAGIVVIKNSKNHIYRLTLAELTEINYTTQTNA